MSKNRSAAGITNIIRQDSSGNIVFTSGSTTLATISTAGQLSGSTAVLSAQTASFVALAQSASNAVAAATASSADNLLVRNTLTAQTLVVQTITSSVDFVTGSTRFGALSSNTHVFTGSIAVTGGLVDINKDGQSLRIWPQSSSGSARIQLQNSGSGGLAGANAIIAVESSTGADQFSGTSPFSLVIGTATQKAFHLGTNSAVVMTITGSNVGIGTTNISTEANLYLGAQGTNEGGQLVLQKGTSYASASHLDNYQNLFRIMSGTDTSSNAVRMSIDMTNGAITTAGPVYRYSGQTVVGGSFTSLTSIDMSSSRTYLIQMIATNVEATLGYRIFGVLQGNATSSTYTFVSLASQTMEIQFSGTTVQARVTNGQQWTFNWSITQLL